MLKGPGEEYILKMSNHLQIVKTKAPQATAAPRGVGTEVLIENFDFPQIV